MNPNENEIIDSTNDNEVEDIDLELEDNEAEEETITIPKKKWTEALAKQEHWKKKANTSKPEVPATQSEHAISFKDSFALAKANVEEDDIEEIADYAKMKKISITEALKTNFVKNLLSEKTEYKKSQEASTTTNAKRGTPKITDDVILENARKGKLGDSEEDIKALFRARMGIK